MLEVTTEPSLYPAFSPAVVEYVNRCDPSTPTAVNVDAPDGTTVSVDGQEARSGSFTTEVDQAVGRRFTVAITRDSTTTAHHVRCLPEDFPAWSAQRTGSPHAQYYSTLLGTTTRFGDPSYAVIMDTNGVPVWWLRNTVQAVLWTPLGNGNFATELSAGPMQEYDLYGRLVRELDTVAGPSDHHDVIVLPNGNYVMVTIHVEPCDLTAWGKPADSTCIAHVLEELTPDGEVAWSWNTAEHIPVTETTERWRNRTLNDPWHWNSVEHTGDGYLLSFRHTDAIYKVARTGGSDDGSIVWKIGGTPRPESLEVVGDPVFTAGGSFSGQHDARWLPDNVVTLYDNGTELRAPRALAYRVDETEGTATLLEEVDDSRFPTSSCCGSARRLPEGNWVVGWGGTNAITEQRPDGTSEFTLTQTGRVYRGIPVLPGQIDPSALRSGMDVQYSK